MPDPLRLHYATDYASNGNVYGYRVHNRETKKALAAAGVIFSEDADTAFHVASPMSFRPLADKRNVLFIAWESDALPPAAQGRIAEADLIFVTAPFLKNVFTAAFPSIPVRVVPLGLNADAFPYRERRIDRRRPFRYLWVGAPNVRKGYELLLDIWRLFAHRDDVELYLKTTVTGVCEKHGNLIFDSRDLPQAQLVDLYHSAQAFVFPTYGEGFGLTLFEALATGLPSIWTDWSAPHDYLAAGKSRGYPLAYEMIDTDIGRMARADPAALAQAMLRVKEDYHNGKAQRKARRAARHVRRSFSWARTAALLIENMRLEPERQHRQRKKLSPRTMPVRLRT